MFNPKIIPSRLITDGAILVCDVDYSLGFPVAAGVLFQDWDSTECALITIKLTDVEEYESGAFYKRELPCILALLDWVEVKLGCIVVDGYVHLGDDKHDGLGAYVNKQTGIPVIGVAKTYFKGTPDECQVVRHGTKPLYVTSIGGDEAAARSCIETMHGNFRIPTMLRRVDQACRDSVFHAESTVQV